MVSRLLPTMTVLQMIVFLSLKLWIWMVRSWLTILMVMEKFSSRISISFQVEHLIYEEKGRLLSNGVVRSRTNMHVFFRLAIWLTISMMYKTT